MNTTGILMGLPAANGAETSGAPIAVLFALFIGFLLVLVACQKQQRGSDAQSRPPCPREWLWAWGFVFAINLPIPLIFGFDATKGGSGAFGMLAGVGVVWLIGHFTVARLNAIRGPLVFGGFFVAISQGLPIAQFVAGALALQTLAGDLIGVKSAPVAFAVTLLTAALLAVVALVIGFALRVTVWLFEGRSAYDPS